MKTLITTKYFFCLNIVFLYSIYGFSQIVNEGVLQIETSTDIYFENEYTNTNSGVHNNNGNLYLNNNFINNGVTTAISGTTYFKSSTNTILNVSGTSNLINLFNLNINVTGGGAKGVSVADNFALIIANAVNFESGDIRLVGDSQIVQTHTGININTVTSGKILRDQQGYESVFKYNYWSSPVNTGGSYKLLGNKFDGTDSNLNAFNPKQILFNSGSPYNGVASLIDVGGNVTTALTISKRWLYKYSRGNSSYSDWISINENSTINPGEGYTMKGSNTTDPNQNYVFYGEPNNGHYQFPISNGEQSLLGNPYPSALDADKFITDNLSVLDALYFWVDGGSTSHILSDYLGGYAVRNLTGGTPPSIPSSLISGIGTAGSVTAPKQFVPVAQGFFIDAYASGNIIFNNSQRVFKTETSGESIFYSSQDASIDSNKYIRIGHEDAEGFHRQLLLGFLQDSSVDMAYNRGYDALMTEMREDDIFFIIDNDLNKKYVIQGVNRFAKTMEFPIGISISDSRTQKIMLDATENFSHPIYIKDNYLNTFHDLTASSFEIHLQQGEYLDRYSIVFNTDESLSNGNAVKKRMKIYYDGLDHIIIDNIQKRKLNSIKLFNSLGQEILSLNNNQDLKNKLSIPFDKSIGVYFLVIETPFNTITQKILIY